MRRTIFVLLLLFCALPAEASLSVVQHCFTTAHTASVSCTLGSNVGATHLLSVTIGTQSSVSITSVTDNDSGGANTYTLDKSQLSSGNGLAAAYYVCSANAGSDTITVAYSSAPNTSWLEAAEISGNATSNCLDTSVAANFTSTTTPSAGSVTTTNANDILIASGAGCSGGTCSTWTATGSYTQLDSQGAVTRGASEYRIVSSTNTYSDSWSLSASNSGAAILEAFKAAGGAAAPIGINKREKLEQIDPQ
jgi:hypothetical protein